PERLAILLLAAEAGDQVAYLELAEDLEEKFVHYRSVLQTRKLSVSQLEITVEAASDKPDDIADADLGRQVRTRPQMADVCFHMLDGLGKGYSVTEIVWDMQPDVWLPKALLWRDPRWFQHDPADGRTLRLRELGSVTGVDLQPYKFITHEPQLKSGLP